MRVPEVGLPPVEAHAAHDEPRAQAAAPAARVGPALGGEGWARGGDDRGERRLGVEVEGGGRGGHEEAWDDKVRVRVRVKS